MQSELIVAAATPPGQGGVGMVRLSGHGAIEVGQTLTGRPLAPRQAERVTISLGQETLDEGLALAFPGPNSFTGEDVVELHCHGSPVVLQRVVNAACELGARLARPGEFSERAFLNDKMDLAQAEAVADLIASGSVQAARAAVRSLQGVFSERVQAINAELEHMRILMEASIDFPEEEEDFLESYNVANQVDEIAAKLVTLLKEARQGQILQQGCSVALLGQPNAGKSSLLNAFTGEETAIVTDIPGTTRDLLQVDLVLDGLPVRLVDTAGLRVTSDPVEREGVARALNQLTQADVIIFVLDLAGELSIAEQIQALLGITELPRDDERLLLVGNKRDLVSAAQSMHELIEISALHGEGLQGLVERICQQVGLGQGEVSFTARARHIESLDSAQSHIQNAQASVATRSGLELIAEELRLGHQSLGEIVGTVSADELLGKIFSQFCIGK